MTDKIKNVPKDTTVVNFAEKIKKLTPKEQNKNSSEETYSTDELLHLGLEAFLENAEDCKAFITITFDSKGDPSIVHAGDIDLLNAIGTLEYAKNELLNSTTQFDMFED